MLTLVLGGVRSGKSAYAQKAAETAATANGGALIMIVTAEPLDGDMKARIAQHRAERGPAWQTVEAPLELPEAIARLQAEDIVVVDCLTLWTSNLLLRGADIPAHAKALCDTIAKCPCPLWLVSNEVGLGVVPDNALARRFRDEAGRLHQRIAAVADEVVMTVAGLPLKVKG
jgi:adenosylcobinamide kinase/adenosylcobinamide-phosphate guanylyltransferase